MAFVLQIVLDIVEIPSSFVSFGLAVSAYGTTTVETGFGFLFEKFKSVRN
jgi:hypothetical protein